MDLQPIQGSSILYDCELLVVFHDVSNSYSEVIGVSNRSGLTISKASNSLFEFELTLKIMNKKDINLDDLKNKFGVEDFFPEKIQVDIYFERYGAGEMDNYLTESKEWKKNTNTYKFVLKAPHGLLNSGIFDGIVVIRIYHKNTVFIDSAFQELGKIQVYEEF